MYNVKAVERTANILGNCVTVAQQTLTLYVGVRIPIPQPKKERSNRFVLFLSNPKDWHGINALARCMELRRSRAWHRAKRVSKFVLLRIDAIHHFVMIPYGTSCQFHTATSCGFHTRLRRDLVHAPPISRKRLAIPRFYAILIVERM